MAWKIARSPLVEKVYVAPGSAGMTDDATVLADHANITDPRAMADLAAKLGADLTVVGPEAPLVAGIADEFLVRGLAVMGPSKAAAQLEGSKIFAKQFMLRHKIATAEFMVATNLADAKAGITKFGFIRFKFPVVIKADGLAAGKGVVVAQDWPTAARALESMFGGGLGDAGRRVVIEQYIAGEEMTFMVIADGKRYVALAPTQDHKALNDGDQGPNTGGMGAYCDDTIMERLGGDALRQRILDGIVTPTLGGMVADGVPYRGILYFGLMVKDAVPYLLEYNCRFGDPETQALVSRMESDIVPLLSGDFSQPPTWFDGATVCVVVASGGYPGSFMRGHQIRGLAEAGALPRVKVFHAGTQLENDTFVTHGGRVLGVTASGLDLPDAIRRAYEAVGKIHFQGMHYRKDIGAKGLR